MPRLPLSLSRSPSSTVRSLLAARCAAAFAIAAMIAGGACIKRTAPPPSTGGTAPGSAPVKVSAAQEAANARIAGIPRVDLLGGQGVGAFKVSGDARKVDMTTIPITGQPFNQALRLAVKDASDHEWAVQLEAMNATALENGDAILATFYLRSETPQQGSVGETELVFELAQSPYTKSIQYPIKLGSDWIKAQVRFKATRAFQAGEAHILFRLGYEPQVLQLAGVSIESFGKDVAVSVLPTTQAADRRRDKTLVGAATAAATAALSGPPIEGGDLRLEVNAAQVIRPISPYVYGINSQPGDGLGITVRRMGGNRGTAYNWELDLSNAGNDYKHQSDDYSCTVMGYSNCAQPAAQYLEFAKSNRHAGWDSIATVPLVDWVTADKDGPVDEKDKAPSKRWVRSLPQKPTAFAASPDLRDGAVYEDEFVNYMVQKLGKASDGGIKFYALDNEPALWPSTHPRVHPDKTTYKEMVERTTATAAALTKVDPSAQIIGATMFGWSEYMTLQDAPDAKTENAKLAGGNGTYVDFLLAAMKRAEDQNHRRLMHLLDFHWYPEARGSVRITDKDVSPKTIDARLQAPRSLWDPTYTEKSWIAATWGKPIRLFRWLQERIDANYPGTKLAMTEYNYGVGDHISGGLAQADVLGVLGREGVYLATYWGDGAGNGPLPKYIKAAFQIFRNYDGKGGTYADTAVQAAPVAAGDLDKTSIVASVDSKHSGTLTVLVINKDQHTAFNGKIEITPEAKSGPYTKAEVFGFDASSAAVRPLPPTDVANNQISYRLQPLSATLFVCHR